MTTSLGQKGVSRGLWITAVVLAISLAIVVFPGSLTPDSQSQLDQARSGLFTDWHPPIMSVLWRIALPLSDGPFPMLIMQVGLHWLGFWAIADRFGLDGRLRLASIIMLSGLTPIALKYLGVIQKDTLVASALIAAFGIVFRSRSRLTIIAACGLTAFATLVRANAVFASPAIFLFILRPKLVPWQATLICAVMSIALIPASMLINAGFKPQRTGVEKSFMLYDLAGIAHFSGDRSVLPMPIPNIERCYTPLFWDTLITARCGNAYERSPDSVLAPWLGAIVRYPLSYAKHRLSHFNSETFFAVPAMQQCRYAPEMHACDTSRKSKVVDWLTKNALLWPCVWLAVALALLTLPLAIGPRSLVLSSSMYGLAYLVVGVASDFRYFYWPILAIQTALLLHFANSAEGWRRVVFSAVTVAALGYSARLIL